MSFLVGLGFSFLVNNFWLLYHVTGKALERTSRWDICPPVLPPLLASHQTGTRGQQGFLGWLCSEESLPSIMLTGFVLAQWFWGACPSSLFQHTHRQEGRTHSPSVCSPRLKKPSVWCWHGCGPRPLIILCGICNLIIKSTRQLLGSSVGAFPSKMAGSFQADGSYQRTRQGLSNKTSSFFSPAQALW